VRRERAPVAGDFVLTKSEICAISSYSRNRSRLAGGRRGAEEASLFEIVADHNLLREFEAGADFSI
jgi:hypothetical protein